MSRRARSILLLALSAAVLIAIPLFLTRLERAFLFHPHAAPPDDAIARRTPGLERWWIDTNEGRVEAFFIPGDGVSAARPGPALVYTHGNAELIDPLPEWLVPYRSMGISLLLPEYRGYGRSAGTPTEEAIRSDLVGFYDRLAARPEVDSSRIAFHGVSLGGGAAAQLASQRRPRAIILQSTFTSVAAIAWSRFYAPRFVIADPFDSLAALRGLDRPALVFHGRRDEVIPFSHGEALHRALPGSRFVAYDDVGHKDLPPPGADYWGEIERFLRASAVIDDRPDR